MVEPASGDGHSPDDGHGEERTNHGIDHAVVVVVSVGGEKPAAAMERGEGFGNEKDGDAGESNGNERVETESPGRTEAALALVPEEGHAG